MKRIAPIFLIVLLAGTATAFADSSLVVNNAAAMEGNFGLEVIADGTPTNAIVRDDTPAGEAIYRFSFLFNINNMSMDVGGRHLMMASAASSVNGTRNIELQVRRTASGYDIRAMNQVTASASTRKKTSIVPLTANGDHLIQVEWQEAPGPGLDGLLRLTVDATTVETNPRNYTQAVINARLGFLGNSIDPGTNGSHYYDDFQSFRTLAP